jgi:hypothetical protein
MINTTGEQYLICKARCVRTGETQVRMDLTGTRLELRQRAVAEDHAHQMAEQLTARTGELWIGLVEVYSPSVRE